MKKYIRKLVFFLAYHLILKKKSTRIVTEKINGFTFKVYPTVFNPCDFISSEVFAGFIKQLDLDKKYILDMGCGSGIVSVFAASKGARCVAVDINPMAIKSTLENASLNRLEDKITAVESDLFESIILPLSLRRGTGLPAGASAKAGERLFDIIFFNPPYHKGSPKNNFERAFKGGANLEVVKQFARNAKKFLASDGVIYLIISSDADIDLIKQMFILQGFKFEIVTNIKKFFETFYIVKSVL